MMSEIRNLNPEASEVRVNGDKRIVEGYAIVFNKRSKPITGEGSFTEVIKPEAIKGVIPKSDVLALLNHDEKRGLLARSNKGVGTLKLEVDPKGVKYRFEAPKTALGEEVLEGIKRGDISSSSFAFNVADNGQSWERRSDGSYERTITKFEQIYDVSPVYLPEAYTDTTVVVRSLQEFRSAEKPPTEEVKPVPEEKVVDNKKKSTLSEIMRQQEILKDKMKDYI